MLKKIKANSKQKKTIFNKTKQLSEVQGDTAVRAPQALTAPNKPRGSPSWFKALL